MTRQILLRTPRGNTAVVPVDHYLLRGTPSGDGGGGGAGSTGTMFHTKEALLYQLIEASRRRDVGRKRSSRDGNDDDDDIEDAFDECGVDGVSYCQPLRGDDCNGEEDPVTMDVDEDQNVQDEDDVGSSDNEEDDEMMVATTTTTTADDREITQRMLSTCISSCHYGRQQPLFSGYPQSSLGGMASSSSSSVPQVALYHQGRKVTLDRLWEWITGTSTGGPSVAVPNATVGGSGTPTFPLYLTLSTTVRLLGGIDRQNRVGSKFGGGGVSSSQQAERERKERLKQLALESIDLAKDPYLMRNHLGTYECKLCLTLHTNEANYLAHTQGKKHQQGLARRAHMEKLRAERQQQLEATAGSGGLKQAPSSSMHQPPQKRLRIGRPAYQVFKSRDEETQQRCLSFELVYPEIEDNLQPRHRFMSAYEQRVESPPDRRYQYLLFAAEPYETVAFKIPNEPIDKEPGRFVTHWDADERKFTLTLYFVEHDGGGGDGTEHENGDNPEGRGNDRGNDDVKVGGGAPIGVH